MTSRSPRENVYSFDAACTSTTSIPLSVPSHIFDASYYGAPLPATALSFGLELPKNNSQALELANGGSTQSQSNINFQYKIGNYPPVTAFQAPSDPPSSQAVIHNPEPYSLDVGRNVTPPCQSSEICEKSSEHSNLAPDLAATNSTVGPSGRALLFDNISVVGHNFFSPSVRHNTMYLPAKDFSRRRSASSATISSEVPSLEGYPPPRNTEEERRDSAAFGDLATVLGANPYPKSTRQISRNKNRNRPTPSPRQPAHVSPLMRSQNDTQQNSNLYHKVPSRMATPFSYGATPPSVSRFSCPETPMSFPELSSTVYGDQRIATTEPVIRSYDFAFGPELPTEAFLETSSFKEPAMISIAPFQLPLSMSLPSERVKSIQSPPANEEPNGKIKHPDIFASAKREPIQPPPEDMCTTDISLLPREQDLRFEGDLYTPKWVRGHGHKREGWCGMCTPGRWLILKNSAFWYDKSFSHGICAGTGALMSGPTKFRQSSSATQNAWDGFCGCCNQWITLTGSKKIGTSWFRHVSKCHSNRKSGESSKRRKVSGQFQSISTPAQSQFSTPPQTPFVASQTHLQPVDQLTNIGHYRSHSTIS